MAEPPLVRDKSGDHANGPESEERATRPSLPTADRPPPEFTARPPPPAAKRSKTPLIVLGIVVVIGAIAGGAEWWLTRNQESTDDAYTDGHAISIAPQVSGVALTLAVTDNERVHAGQLLVQIDPRDYQAARDEAAGSLEVNQAQLADAREAYTKAQVQFPAQLQASEAELVSAQATLTNAQADYKRQQSLPRAATSQQLVDDATAKLHQAEALVQQSKANLLQAQLVAQNIAQAAARVKQWEGQVGLSRAALDRAELNLSYTKVLAPADGWITERRVEQGDYLQTGGALLAVVSPQVWVTANFKETQLARLRPGQKVAMTVDAFPNLKLAGHIDSIQMGSGARFTAFPAENATGNYVKIVQRVPVKIAIDSGFDQRTRLPLGISVEATVTVE